MLIPVAEVGYMFLTILKTVTWRLKNVALNVRGKRAEKQ